MLLFHFFIQSYYDFSQNFTVDQQIILFNFLGSILLLSYFTSILLIFYGNYLIKRFYLEKRIPRIAVFLNIEINFKNITYIGILYVLLYY